MLRKMVLLSCTLLLITISVFGAESEAVRQHCGDAQVTFEDWRQWTSVTTIPVRSKGHSNNWVGIYVNKLAAETYLSASSPYPVCAKIVKPIYTDSSGTEVRKLTIMVKMPPGYDPENADWWYGQSDDTGIEVWGGKLTDCIVCHKQAANGTSVFGMRLMWESVADPSDRFASFYPDLPNDNARFQSALGLDSSIAATVKPVTAKLADNETREWVTRYRKEKGDHESST